MPLSAVGRVPTLSTTVEERTKPLALKVARERPEPGDKPGQLGVPLPPDDGGLVLSRLIPRLSTRVALADTFNGFDHACSMDLVLAMTGSSKNGKASKYTNAVPSMVIAFWFSTTSIALSVQPSADVVYNEVLGVNVGLTGMARGIGKSLDLLVGFLIGYMADTCTWKMGRRRPFVLFGMFTASTLLHYHHG